MIIEGRVWAGKHWSSTDVALQPLNQKKLFLTYIYIMDDTIKNAGQGEMNSISSISSE